MPNLISNLHPKVAAGALAALAANLATVAAAIGSAATWRDAIAAIVLIDGPIVVAWIKRADKTAGAVVEALEPVLVEKLATSPEAPASPTGNIINPT